MNDRPSDLMLFDSVHETVKPIKVFARSTKRCQQCLRRAIYWHGEYLCREHAEQLASILRRLEYVGP